VIDSPAAGFLSLGQPTAQRIARRSAASGQIARTLLVHGPAGAGKRAFVDDLLALALCEAPDPMARPCNQCRGCRQGRARTHPDLVIGSPEAWREARATGESIVAAARRWLGEIAGAPIVAPRRIILVEGADRATEAVQNALLKTLEEPTDRHTFILVADEPSRLLATIRSRCQPLRIGPVPRAELVEHLMAVRALPEDQAQTLARLANGLAGTALAFADRTDLLTWRRRLHAELLALLDRGPADRIGAARDLLDEASRMGVPAPAQDDEADGDPRATPSQARAGATLIVEGWLDFTRDLLVAAAAGPHLAPSGELGNEVETVGRRIGVAPLAEMARLLERIHDGLRENLAPRLAIERAMLAWPTLAR
jgi:DNA polymerase-3 subunit delta'